MDPSTQTAMEKESFIASKAYRKAPRVQGAELLSCLKNIQPELS
jgi:hypothetical protein